MRRARETLKRAEKLIQEVAEEELPAPIGRARFGDLAGSED
jgi:hypothetical protein